MVALLGQPVNLERMGARMDALVARRRQLEGTLDTLLVELLTLRQGSWHWLLGRSRLCALGREVSQIRREFEPLAESFISELDRRATEAAHTGGA